MCGLNVDFKPYLTYATKVTTVSDYMKSFESCTVVAGSHMLPAVRAAVRLRIHRSSVLWRVRPSMLVFHSVQQGPSGWHEMQDVTAIQPEWLPEIAPNMFRTVARARPVPGAS